MGPAPRRLGPAPPRPFRDKPLSHFIFIRRSFQRSTDSKFFFFFGCFQFNRNSMGGITSGNRWRPVASTKFMFYISDYFYLELNGGVERRKMSHRPTGRWLQRWRPTFSRQIPNKYAIKLDNNQRACSCELFQQSSYSIFTIDLNLTPLNEIMSISSRWRQAADISPTFCQLTLNSIKYERCTACIGTIPTKFMFDISDQIQIHQI